MTLLFYNSNASQAAYFSQVVRPGLGRGRPLALHTQLFLLIFNSDSQKLFIESKWLNLYAVEDWILSCSVILIQNLINWAKYQSSPEQSWNTQNIRYMKSNRIVRIGLELNHWKLLTFHSEIKKSYPYQENTLLWHNSLPIHHLFFTTVCIY